MPKEPGNPIFTENRVFTPLIPVYLKIFVSDIPVEKFTSYFVAISEKLLRLLDTLLNM
jgi:hypothetical protein